MVKIVFGHVFFFCFLGFGSIKLVVFGTVMPWSLYQLFWPSS